jgi:eukaryotic-like serine/threonine-protein kinase
MTEPVFRQIGPYEIQRRIGTSMSSVYLAQDTRPGGRLVALKVVPDGLDVDAQDTAVAEQQGAELQRTLLNGSEYVPRVYEVERVTGYLYIAMEYLEGTDLSSLIRQGPIDPRRSAAIAIQLCQFLEEIDRIESRAHGSAALTLLHNDLKPTNVRLVKGDRVKVLDFGAAKTLSMSRRVTRNDFYSTPYLSPECLDSGERDRQTDAWALGVILYEMVAGRPPFRADDTRRLENRIRSRRPPEPIPGCPPGLHAIIAKLLAPQPADRYAGPEAIREDLERFTIGTATKAEAEGWPDKVADEPPTRRVRAEAPDRAEEPPTRHTPRVAVAAAASGTTAPDPMPQAARPAKTRHWIQGLLLFAVLSIGGNEACVSLQARQVAATVPMQEFAGLTNIWSNYDGLSSRSWLGGLGVRRLGDALARQTLILAERVTDNYRTPAPTVREAQWLAAATALTRALTVAPTDAKIRGTLRYCEGQLHRIDGEARKGRKQAAQAQREFAEAVSAFREAATLRPNWPDPFLGLARTFIYGNEDIDRGADAMKQAERLGHALGPRETAQLGDGYRARGETLERAAAALVGMPQEREMLTRSRDAYRQALDLYATIATFADVAAQIRATQRHLDVVEKKLNQWV